MSVMTVRLMSEANNNKGCKSKIYVNIYVLEFIFHFNLSSSRVNSNFGSRCIVVVVDNLFNMKYTVSSIFTNSCMYYFIFSQNSFCGKAEYVFIFFSDFICFPFNYKKKL